MSSLLNSVKSKNKKTNLRIRPPFVQGKEVFVIGWIY